MYDRDVVKCMVTSPWTSELDDDLAYEEYIEAFKAGVRGQIASPGQLDMINELNDKYGNGETRIGMAIGYPFGGHTTEYKLYLLRQAIDAGMQEVNVAPDINAVSSHDWKRVEDEMRAIVEMADGRIKIIPMLWIIKLNFDTVDELCKIYRKLGITAIKTSAGVHFGKMQIEHVQWIRRNYPEFSIEVAGRCRDRDTTDAMFRAGACCIHTGGWRKLSGIGVDPIYDPDIKQTSPAKFFRNIDS